MRRKEKVMKFVAPTKHLDIFKRYALEPTERIIPNIQRLLGDWTIYLWHNPNAGVVNGNGPHTDPRKKSMYIPMVKVLPADNDNDLIAQVDIWKHEGGHALHLELLGDDPIKWREWSEETGHPLVLTGRYGGGTGLEADPRYWYVPSYEEFAIDIYNMIKNAEPHPYYMRLLGLRYQVLTPGSLEYNVNGLLLDKDSAPLLIKGRTYTPTRHTHESFGDTVNFINGKVIIIRNV